jgi:hypothetical protein
MNQYFPDTTVPGTLHDVDFMRTARGSRTAADGDGRLSNTTPYPTRSRPASRLTKPPQANDAKCGFACHTRCRRGITFSRTTEKDDDRFLMPPRAPGITAARIGLASANTQVDMSKRENESNNALRPSDRPFTEYEEEQKALRKNLERLRAERRAREKPGANDT